MSIFTNIHKIASRIIPRQPAQFRKGMGRTITPAGIAKPTYGEWQDVIIHLQPGFVSSNISKNANEQIYDDFGLNFTDVKYTIWIDDTDAETLRLADTTDQFKIHGKIYNVIFVADWLEFSGWKNLYVKEVMQ